MTNRRVFPVVLMWIIIHLTASVMAGPIRLNLAKGDQFRTLISSSQVIIQAVGDTENQVTHETTIHLLYTVTASSDETITLNVRFERIHGFQQTPAGKVTMDTAAPTPSDTETANPLDPIYRALTAHAFSITLDRSTGALTRVSGWDQLIQASLAAAGIQPEDPQADQLAQQMQQAMEGQLGSRGFAGMVAPVIGRDPKVGDRFTVQETVQLGSNLTVANAYTVVSRTADALVLQLTADLRTPEPAPVSAGPMGRMRRQLHGTQTGTLTVDPTTGWIRESRVQHTLTGTIEMLDQSFSIPIRLEGTLVTRSVPVP